jgi:urea transport system substrate-binding protein
VGKAKRVLVVEDDGDIRAMIELTLEAEGHRVLSASNGAEGLARASADAVDVILLDLKMPVMDGWEFARRYREAGGSAPIVVLSAAQDAERHARAIGAEHVLTKPFELEALLAIVASVGGERSTPREQ